MIFSKVELPPLGKELLIRLVNCMFALYHVGSIFVILVISHFCSDCTGSWSLLTISFQILSLFSCTLAKNRVCVVHAIFVTHNRLSQDQMQFFVSSEVIFQGCLSDFILCILKSTNEAVSENVYIGYNIL